MCLSVRGGERHRNVSYLVTVEVSARAEANSSSPCNWPKDERESAACNATACDTWVTASILPVPEDQSALPCSWGCLTYWLPKTSFLVPPPDERPANGWPARIGAAFPPPPPYDVADFVEPPELMGDLTPLPVLPLPLDPLLLPPPLLPPPPPPPLPPPPPPLRRWSLIFNRDSEMNGMNMFQTNPLSLRAVVRIGTARGGKGHPIPN
jgi:hypothetical protein